MSADLEHQDLVLGAPLVRAMSGGGQEVAVRLDPWVEARRAAVARHPQRLPGRVVWYCVSTGLGWHAKYVGVLLSFGGPPSPRHIEGRVAVFMPRRPTGKEYWLLPWIGRDPFILQVWDMVAEKPGLKKVRMLMRWRPGLPEPEWVPVGLHTIRQRTKRDAVQREMTAFVEPPARVGAKKKRGRSDPKFERDLEDAILKVIHQEEGKEPSLAAILTAMEYKPDTYYRRIKDSGWTSDQVLGWVKEAVREYWSDWGSASATTGWRPESRLRDLPRNFCD